MQTPVRPPLLPDDADGLLKMAAQSMFDVFARTAMGMLVVDRDHRVVWISDGYKSFLPALGFARVEQFVGHMVEDRHLYSALMQAMAGRVTHVPATQVVAQDGRPGHVAVTLSDGRTLTARLLVGSGDLEILCAPDLPLDTDLVAMAEKAIAARKK